MTIAFFSSPSSTSFLSSSGNNNNNKEELPSHASFDTSDCRAHRRHSYHFLHSLFSSSSFSTSSCYCCCCFDSVHADEASDLLLGTYQPFSGPASLLNNNNNNNNNNVRSSTTRSKWKQFWRKIRAQTRKMHCSRPVLQKEVHYDPLSYALNFDDRTWMKHDYHASFFTPRLIPNTLETPRSISISTKDIGSFTCSQSMI